MSVTIWQGTQDPTDENLPKTVREGAHVRASLVVGTAEQAKMALGAKAVDGGAAPHLLRQGLDKGTVVVAGDVGLAPGETSVTVRTHFVDGAAAVEIAARLVATRHGRGGPATAGELDAAAPDHLAHIVEAMRDEPRVRTTVLLGRLAELDAEVYEPWTHADLARELLRYGIAVRKSGGVKVVRLDDVAPALAARDGDPAAEGPSTASPQVSPGRRGGDPAGENSPEGPDDPRGDPRA